MHLLTAGIRLKNISKMSFLSEQPKLLYMDILFQAKPLYTLNNLYIFIRVIADKIFLI